MIDLTLERINTFKLGLGRVTASPYGSNDAIEPAVGGIINDPSSLFILVGSVDLKMELGALLEAVRLPQLADLFQNL